MKKYTGKLFVEKFITKDIKFFPTLLIQICVLFAYLGNFSFRPINHLFVDDWAIFKNFNLDNSGFNSTNLTSYNGNPLFFSRILFIFVTDVLRIDISTMALILFLLYFIVLYYFATKITYAIPNSNWARTGIVIIGLNLNQYQNFAMPICWPWIISLIVFYLSYILSVNNTKILKYLLLSLLILASPQIFSLGFIVPIGILLINLIMLLSKTLEVKRVGLLILSVLSIVISYFISIVNNQDDYEKNLSLNPLFVNPRGAFTFMLSSFGSPFTPASTHSVVISIAFGILILALVVFTVKKNSVHDFFESRSLILYGLIFHILQLIARFDGSKESIEIVNQPRYTTGALILIMGLFLSYTPKILNRRNHFVFFIALSLMSLAGAKTSWDFAEIRGRESADIENCLINKGYQDLTCRQLLNPGPDVLSGSEFADALNYLELRHKL